VSWPEVIITILKLVDGDSICDFCGQGVPLVDHLVCECVGLLLTFSRSLARQSPRMTSDASGGAGLREWAAVDRRVHSLRWCRWRVWIAVSGLHVDGTHGKSLILGRQGGLRSANYWCGAIVWWLSSAPSQQSGVFLTVRGPDSCGIFQEGPFISAVEGPAGVEAPISKWSLQLAENSRGFVELNFDIVKKFQSENVTPRSFSVSTKASSLLWSSSPINSSDCA